MKSVASIADWIKQRMKREIGIERGCFRYLIFV